ncbi:MAG: hypothetical protein WBH47_00435 [Streptosporangiaceae bacterium]
MMRARSAAEVAGIYPELAIVACWQTTIVVSAAAGMFRIAASGTSARSTQRKDERR